MAEENPNSEAKATGGGKTSGIGGEGGLSGTEAPRNELNMRELKQRQQKLRRDAESLHAKSQLLYLPSGELDKAVLLMHKADRMINKRDFQGFAETQRRIVHALRNTQRELKGEEPIRLDPRLKLPGDVLREIYDARDEEIPPEFEDLVSDYYKAIASGRVK